MNNRHKDHIEEVRSVGALYHYKEAPVDIITFLEDEQYLGNATRKLSAIYPGWMIPMGNIFREDRKYLVVLTGAIGTGKTQVVCGYCIPYILYRISMLKDPWQYFEKGPSGKMDVSFFNLTKSLSGSRGFAYMQNSLQSSPWFRARGRMTGGHEPQMELDLFNWMLASPYAKGFGQIGGNIVAGVMDEVDSPNESEGQKKRVLEAFEGTKRRFESRFVQNDASLGRLFLVASKQDELSFLEMFIEDMKHSSKVQIFDKAQWEVKRKGAFSGAKFSVMAGDTYVNPRIIGAEEKEKYIKEGMRVISMTLRRT
jgi:hypothetical protein